MDLKTYRDQILRREIRGGRKLIEDRRAYNNMLRAGGTCGASFDFQIQTTPNASTYDVNKEGLKSFLDKSDGIIMVYANWCPASQNYKAYFESLPELPLIMYDCANETNTLDDIGTTRLGVPLSMGVNYYPTIFFLHGDRSMNFDVPKKPKEEVVPEYNRFRQASPMPAGGWMAQKKKPQPLLKGGTVDDRVADFMTSENNFLDFSNLNLYGTPEQLLQNVLATIKQIRYLDMGNNKLSSFAFHPPIGQHMRTLNLNHNNLTDLPNNFGTSFPVLQTLRLRVNEFESIPSSILDLPALELLDMVENNLLTLPTNINQMTSLQRLFLSRNLLTSLPDVLATMGLQTLEVDNNFLVEVPDWLKNAYCKQYPNQQTTAFCQGWQDGNDLIPFVAVDLPVTVGGAVMDVHNKFRKSYGIFLRYMLGPMQDYIEMEGNANELDNDDVYGPLRRNGFMFDLPEDLLSGEVDETDIYETGNLSSLADLLGSVDSRTYNRRIIEAMMLWMVDNRMPDEVDDDPEHLKFIFSLRSNIHPPIVLPDISIRYTEIQTILDRPDNERTARQIDDGRGINPNTDDIRAFTLTGQNDPYQRYRPLSMLNITSAAQLRAKLEELTHPYSLYFMKAKILAYIMDFPNNGRTVVTIRSYYTRLSYDDMTDSPELTQRIEQVLTSLENEHLVRSANVGDSLTNYDPAGNPVRRYFVVSRLPASRSLLLALLRPGDTWKIYRDMDVNDFYQNLNNNYNNYNYNTLFGQLGTSINNMNDYDNIQYNQSNRMALVDVQAEQDAFLLPAIVEDGHARGFPQGTVFPHPFFEMPPDLGTLHFEGGIGQLSTYNHRRLRMLNYERHVNFLNAVNRSRIDGLQILDSRGWTLVFERWTGGLGGGNVQSKYTAVYKGMETKRDYLKRKIRYILANVGDHSLYDTRLWRNFSRHVIILLAFLIKLNNQQLTSEYLTQFVRQCLYTADDPNDQAESCPRGMKERLVMILEQSFRMVCCNEKRCATNDLTQAVIDQTMCPPPYYAQVLNEIDLAPTLKPLFLQLWSMNEEDIPVADRRDHALDFFTGRYAGDGVDDAARAQIRDAIDNKLRSMETNNLANFNCQEWLEVFTDPTTCSEVAPPAPQGEWQNPERRALLRCILRQKQTGAPQCCGTTSTGMRCRRAKSRNSLVCNYHLDRLRQFNGLFQQPDNNNNNNT